MKNILIIGNCRAGKTLMARALMQRMPHMAFIGTDHMRSAIMKTLLHDVTDFENDPQCATFDAQWGSRLIEINKRFFISHIRSYNQDNKFFIMEGGVIKFDDAAEFINDPRILIVCVGKPQLDADAYYNDIRAWDQKHHTWTTEHTDVDVRGLAEKYARESRSNFEKCLAAGVIFVDTSFNQMAVIDAAADQISTIATQ